VYNVGARAAKILRIKGITRCPSAAIVLPEALRN
jgi:hypothetical protein